MNPNLSIVFTKSEPFFVKEISPGLPLISPLFFATLNSEIVNDFLNLSFFANLTPCFKSDALVIKKRGVSHINTFWLLNSPITSNKSK